MSEAIALSRRHIFLSATQNDHRYTHDDFLLVSQSVRASSHQPKSITINSDDNHGNRRDFRCHAQSEMHQSLYGDMFGDELEHKDGGSRRGKFDTDTSEFTVRAEPMYNLDTVYDTGRFQVEKNMTSTGDVVKVAARCWEQNDKQASQIVFVCVKYGPKYGAEYVNNLFISLKKGTIGHYNGNPDNIYRGAFRLVCYTDDPSGVSDEIEVQLIPGRTLGKSPPTLISGKEGKEGETNSQVLFPFVLDEDITTAAPAPASADSLHIITGSTAEAVSVIRGNNETEKETGTGTGTGTGTEKETETETETESDTEIPRGVIKESALTRVLAEGMKEWRGWWLKAYLFYAANDLANVDKVEATGHSDLSGSSDDVGKERIKGVRGEKESKWEAQSRSSVKKKIEIMIKDTLGNGDGDDYEKSKRVMDVGETLLQEKYEQSSNPLWVCYLDLDTVIKGPLDFLFDILLSESTSYSSSSSSPNCRFSNPSLPSSAPSSLPSSSSTPFSDSEIKIARGCQLFYTLGAAHFESEGRPCGINSSLMMWQTTPRRRSRGSDSCCEVKDAKRGREWAGNITRREKEQETDGINHKNEGREAILSYNFSADGFEDIFFYLLDNYEAVTGCVHKFDHYLEMMLLNFPSTPVPTLRNVQVRYHTRAVPPISHNSYVSVVENERAIRNESQSLLEMKEGSENTYNCDNDNCSGAANGRQRECERVREFESGPLPAMDMDVECSEEGVKEACARVIYLQDLRNSAGKIVDFSSLLVTFPPATSLSSASKSTASPSLSYSATPSKSDVHVNGFLKQVPKKFKDDVQSIYQYDGSWMNERLLSSASVICFPLNPKPKEVAQKEQWMKDLWEGTWDDHSQ